MAQTTNLDFLEAKQSILDRLFLLPEEFDAHKPLLRICIKRLFEDAASTFDGDKVFITTGDIDAMWLRDSSFQIKPLLRFSSIPSVADFILGVIRAQSFFINIDPVANAFNKEPNGMCWHRDFETQSPWVFERKWEIDSLASFLDVSLGMLERGHAILLKDELWNSAVSKVITQFELEQEHNPESYIFIRQNAPAHDYLSNDGRGEPYESCGLIWSAFRPSDDACELPFNIPQNAYSAAQLKRLAKFTTAEMAAKALKLSTEISEAITRYGLSNGRYSYEVDGLGNRLEMDDANIPSLLSLPYLGFLDSNDADYLRTRNWVLSQANPWYFSGPRVAHVGSPHTGKDRVWPLAMAMEIITSTKTELEKLDFLGNLALESEGLHESVSTSNVSDFTREWFSWAEMTYFDAVLGESEKFTK